MSTMHNAQSPTNLEQCLAVARLLEGLELGLKVSRCGEVVRFHVIGQLLREGQLIRLASLNVENIESHVIVVMLQHLSIQVLVPVCLSKLHVTKGAHDQTCLNDGAALGHLQCLVWTLKVLELAHDAAAQTALLRDQLHQKLGSNTPSQ
jgi:hypothetical protein